MRSRTPYFSHISLTSLFVVFTLTPFLLQNDVQRYNGEDRRDLLKCFRLEITRHSVDIHIGERRQRGAQCHGAELYVLAN